MISLDDARAKNLAEVLGNQSCKKIISVLTDKELSESDISKQLKMPLNSVGYNIKKLLEAGLIEKSKDFFWSTKGKKIPVYKLSNKKIIISPRTSKLETLKTFSVPILLTGLGAIIIQQMTKVSNSSVESLDTGARAMASQALEESSRSALSNVSIFANFNPWSWFLIGAWFAIFLFFILNLKRNK